MWSIGLYRGDSPCRLRDDPEVCNPILQPRDVTDINGVSIADPFMLKGDHGWNMFFEVLDGTTGKGSIGLATSDDAIRWNYRRIVLAERFHLSYPYVFRLGNDHYMIPETVEGGGVSIYRAKNYPLEWNFERHLISGRWADPSIFHYAGRWWLFVCGTPKESNSLHLYHALDPLGEWSEHPLSPLITNNHRAARPAGRVTLYQGGLLRFCQDCEPHYGSRVRAFEITALTPTTYEEKEHPLSPILQPSGAGWNSKRMHHLDPHLEFPGEWIACVDGFS